MKKAYKTPKCISVSINSTPLLVNSPENIDIDDTPKDNVSGDAKASGIGWFEN